MSIEEPPFQRSRVLVIDDNIDAATALCFLLEEHGYQSARAYNGHNGFGLALEFRPTVVLLDIGLPGLDGFQVARLMRQSELLKQVYIIAITGYATDEDRAKAREAGIDAHLHKPVMFSQLESLLKSAISSSM